MKNWLFSKIKKMRKASCGGFTMIEIMIVLGLLGLVLITASSVMRYYITKYNQYMSYFQYKSDVVYVMNNINNEIRSNPGAAFESDETSGDKVVLGEGETKKIIINSKKNPSLGEEGSISYKYTANRFGEGFGYGEIFYNGKRIAQNIRDFKVEDSNGLIKITLLGGTWENSRPFEITTYVRLYN